MNDGNIYATVHVEGPLFIPKGALSPVHEIKQLADAKGRFTGFITFVFGPNTQITAPNGRCGFQGTFDLSGTCSYLLLLPAEQKGTTRIYQFIPLVFFNNALNITTGALFNFNYYFCNELLWHDGSDTEMLGDYVIDGTGCPVTSVTPELVQSADITNKP